MASSSSQLRYQDKVTIVTGGSKGIGEGIVREFGKAQVSHSINTGERTEWSLIRSVIIRVIYKIMVLQFVNHEYDYRSTSDDTKSSYQLIIKISIFEKHKK